MKLHEVISEIIKGRGFIYARGVSPETEPFDGEYKITYGDGSLEENIEKINFWKIWKACPNGSSSGSIPTNIDWNIHISDKI